MRVWAYGDSHTAGAELGYSEKSLTRFQPGGKHFGKNWNKHLIDRGEYTQLISGAIACAPENSWAGQLAQLLGAEYICKAIPGWSNDGCIRIMLEDMPNWKDDDIILWGVATPWRYTPAGDRIHAGNHQLARMPKGVRRTLIEYGPHDITLLLWTQGLMHLAKSLHKNMKMVLMSSPSLTVNEYNATKDLCVIDIPFGTFQSHDIGTYFGNPTGKRYTVLPETHYDRACHRDYAQLIYNTLGEKNV